MGESPEPSRPDAPREPPPLSKVQLDALLEELLARVSDVTASRERLRGLLRAVVSIGSDLELPGVLERIVAAACELVNARYGALAVLGPKHRLTAFHTHGTSRQEVERLGGLPRGRDVLRLVDDDTHGVRLANLTTDHTVQGLVSGQSAPLTFLGVPIRIREQVFGALYLTEKPGFGQFSQDDEEVILALAAAAGVAIENAQLYEISNRRQRWLQAAAEITNLLLGTVDPQAALRLVASRARETGSAYLAAVVLRDEISATGLTVEVAGTAEGASELVGARLRLADDRLGAVIRQQESVIVDDLGKATDWPIAMTTGPAVMAPLSTNETTYGALIVASSPGSPTSYTGDDMKLLENFAGQAALALERARSQQDRANLAVFEDRERIARDLHDLVIQRLFATGLQLQSAIHLTSRPAVAERLNVAVDELDATIRDIRASIFQLHRVDANDLRAGVRTVADSAYASLGFRPHVMFDGPIDSLVPESLRPHVLAVLREALSNVARHAGASRVEVVLRADAHTVALSIEDDGIGLGGQPWRGGLRNLRERATRRAGSFSVTAVSPLGTRLTWSVPLENPTPSSL